MDETLIPPDSRRILAKRVRDVPRPERIRAAERYIMKLEDDPLERLRIMALAHEPGELVAWVAR